MALLEFLTHFTQQSFPKHNIQTSKSSKKKSNFYHSRSVTRFVNVSQKREDQEMFFKIEIFHRPKRTPRIFYRRGWLSGLVKSLRARLTPEKFETPGAAGGQFIPRDAIM